MRHQWFFLLHRILLFTWADPTVLRMRLSIVFYLPWLALYLSFSFSSAALRFNNVPDAVYLRLPFDTVLVDVYLGLPWLPLFITLTCNLGVLGDTFPSRMISLSFSKLAVGSGLGNMSVDWPSDFTGWMFTLPCLTYSTKCQYLILMCLVLGLIPGLLQSLWFLCVSSKTLYIILVPCLGIPIFFSLSSSRSFIFLSQYTSLLLAL